MDAIARKIWDLKAIILELECPLTALRSSQILGFNANPLAAPFNDDILLFSRCRARNEILEQRLISLDIVEIREDLSQIIFKFAALQEGNLSAGLRLRTGSLGTKSLGTGCLRTGCLRWNSWHCLYNRGISLA
jgi:hypothetical protein